jgi:hypothetical protein
VLSHSPSTAVKPFQGLAGISFVDKPGSRSLR